MMNSKFYFAALAALAIVACNEKPINESLCVEEQKQVQLTVTVDDGTTKITGSSDDKNINDIQIFVFDKYGVYETSASSATMPVTLTCTAGEKQIVALVNAEPEENVKNLADLSARKAYLADSSGEDLVMVGDANVTLFESAPVSISVKRLAAKVLLKSVTLSFALPQHRDLSFEITSVYLINAVGDKAYMSGSTPTIWYNVGAYDPSNSLPMLYDAVTEGVIVSGDNPYNIDHYFYCYPNATATKTRLVIEALIGGNTYYYPITLDQIESNNMYAYDVKLTRPGTDSPDLPIQEGSVNFSVTVQGWDENPEKLEL